MTQLKSHYINSFDQKKIFFQSNFEPNLASDAKVVMFNYGLVCSNHHWSKQVSYFQELGYNIILQDYRGHFNSAGADDIPSITFANMAKDMEMILNYLGVKKTHMLGHSMGVNVTLEFARTFPDRIESMILIGGTVLPVTEVMFDTNMMDVSLPYFKMLFEKFPDQTSFVWKTSGKNPLIQAMIMDGGFNKQKVSMEFVQIYLNRIGLLTPELFFKLFQEMTDHNIMSYLESIETRSLVIGGEKDKVIPFSMQRLLKGKLKNSELYMVKNGSHVPQVDFPELLNERFHFFFSN
ncbi:MAG: alpha/beta fold hydrolase [Bacteriovoracaceae bacterium]